MEYIDDLQLNGLKIIQKEEAFKFGIDAVLLSDFISAPDDAKVLDIGTGTGILPLLMSAKTNASYITGIEIQAEMVDVAQKSVAMNHLDEKIDIIEGDIRVWHHYFKRAVFDVVVANPPYMNKGSGLVNPGSSKAIARHEIMCTLQDVVSAAANVLKMRGSFFMVHRPSRLADIISVFREYRIEPKIMQMVHSHIKDAPSLVLIKGVKGGKTELIVRPPVILNEEGKDGFQYDGQ